MAVILRPLEEGKNPSLSSLSNKQKTENHDLQDLGDVVVAAAVNVNKNACISQSSKAEILKVIAQKQATPEEVTENVRSIVGPMDDFQLKNAGTLLASNLGVHILALRQRKAEAERQSAIHQQEMCVAQESIAQHEASLEQAVAKAEAERDRLRTHYPDDSFCACPICQPDFWAEKDKDDGAALEAFGFESSECASGIRNP